MQMDSGIQAYLAPLEADVQERMRRIRDIFFAAIPNPGEGIKYKMPMVSQDGKALVYYAAWKKHIGLYPIPTGDQAFEERIGPYRAAKDTVQLPHKKPLPIEVVEAIAGLVAQKRLPHG